MSLLSQILLLIVSSRLLGQLMVRLKQPSILGEILAGVILGPTLLNLVQSSKELEGIAELSVFLIVLAAGLEMEFKDVVSSVRGRGFIASSLDFVLPLAGGFFVGIAFGQDTVISLFLGLCMSITALPVAIRILDAFKMINSTIAQYSIATSIINDVAALLMLGVILTPAGQSANSGAPLDILLSIALTALKLAVFAFVVALVNRLLRWGGRQTGYIERALEKLIELFGREALFGIAVLFVLIFASVSETLGSHVVIGTFFGALLLSKDVFGTSLFSELENTINSITNGFLAPIFFATLGLRFSVTSFGENPWFVLTVLLVAVITKIVAGYAGARWIKMSHIEALGVGIILNGRGIMELIVANIAYQAGLIDQDMFSVLVIMGLFTTLITPLLFRKFVYSKLPPVAT